MIIGKWAAPLILKEVSVGMKSWHENRVFGEYANTMRIKQKHFSSVHLCQEFYAQNIPPNDHSYIQIIQFHKYLGFSVS